MSRPSLAVRSWPRDRARAAIIGGSTATRVFRYLLRDGIAVVFAIPIDPDATGRRHIRVMWEPKPTTQTGDEIRAFRMFRRRAAAAYFAETGIDPDIPEA